MNFVLVPNGSFDRKLPGKDSIQRVNLTSSFLLMDSEVTNKHFRAYRPQHNSGSYEGHSLNEDDQPAVLVSWFEAEDFAEWLTSQDPEHSYRLPTEAEWEWACRRGRRMASLGCRAAGVLTNYANFSDRLDPSGPACPDVVDGYAVTAPVRSFLPNELGVFDLLGNVREWCGDWYAPYVAGLVRDPQGPSEANAQPYWIAIEGGRGRSARARVMRGGSWAAGPEVLSCESRVFGHPDQNDDETGFRLVAVPTRARHQVSRSTGPPHP